MFKRVVLALLAFLICVMAGGSGAEEPQKKVMSYLAVMDLNCGTALNKESCTALTNIVIDELVNLKKYTVIDRANRDKILSEAGFQQSGCVDESCTIEMGRQLGVGKLVVGSITKLGTTYLVNLQLLNVETAAVDISATEECECELNGLIKSMRNAARKLMGEETISAQPKPQPQPQPPPINEPPPSPEDIKFMAASPEQQKLCPYDMAYIPAGWFMMGCNSTQDFQCDNSESPYHPVYLDAYCIDKYEYPNRAGANPQTKVNWSAAQGFCSSLGKKLPTEAQWEKAARGTDGRIYPWGNFLDDDKKKALMNDYLSGAYLWNVGPYGVYDMSGNYWEWVSDWYDPNYYGSSPAVNPTGPTSAKWLVLKGGSWGYEPVVLRLSGRNGNSAGSVGRMSGYSFRCAKTP